MTARKVVLVSGGINEPSSTRLLGDRLVSATAAAMANRGVQTSVEVIELRGLAHDVTNAVLTGFASPHLAAALDDMRHADALIVVSPIFNASYSGLFKSFFDVLEEDSFAPSRFSWPPPGARSGTRSPWSMGCVRCLPTCEHSSFRQRCTPHRLTGARPVASMGLSPSASIARQMSSLSR